MTNNYLINPLLKRASFLITNSTQTYSINLFKSTTTSQKLIDFRLTVTQSSPLLLLFLLLSISEYSSVYKEKLNLFSSKGKEVYQKVIINSQEKIQNISQNFSFNIHQSISSIIISVQKQSDKRIALAYS